jgi:hypothetical protein
MPAEAGVQGQPPERAPGPRFAAATRASSSTWEGDDGRPAVFAMALRGLRLIGERPLVLANRSQSQRGAAGGS